MKKLLFSGCVLFALVSVAQAQPITAAQIAHDIRVRGSQSVVRSLTHEGLFDRVLDEISSGNTEWIHLAPRLANGADAGNSEGLAIALAQALPKNPKAVLAVLDEGPVMNVDQVCGVPFIEPTPREIEDYLKQAIPAVKRLQKSGHSLLVGKCLKKLQQIRTR